VAQTCHRQPVSGIGCLCTSINSWMHELIFFFSGAISSFVLSPPPMTAVGKPFSPPEPTGR
jgi:hypothetical protein